MNKEISKKKERTNVFYALLLLVFSVIKRLTGMIFFILGLVICGMTVFPLIFLFFGIDKANDWMDRNILPFVEWWD
jgi:hypothetical protein